MSTGERALLGALAEAPPVDPRPAFATGELVGRYRIEAFLGAGTSAHVYRARDTALDRAVALKVMRRPLTPLSTSRFMREARAAARVRHEEIAVPFDVFEHGGRAVLAMELAAGPTLRDELRAGGALGPSRAASLVVAIARAMAATHRAGVVHRDLKPENVISVGGGRVKILDFGLASVAGDGAPADAAAGGTLAYAAPEAGASAASDQFALGVMLVELATGEDPRRAREVAAGLPEPLRAVAERALATRPSRRFEDCDALASALAMTVTTSRPRAGRWLAPAVAATLLAAALPFARPPAAPLTRAVAPAVVARDGGTIACPPLATVEERDRWLGAAVASAICRRLEAMRGGTRDVVAPPAELLGLPRTPTRDCPIDPYASPEARDDALAEAAARGAFIDGTVERRETGFVLRLSVRGADGETSEEVEHTGTFASVVASALDDLAGRGAFSELPIEPGLRRFSGLPDRAALVALTDASIGADAGTDPSYARARLEDCGGGCEHLRAAFEARLDAGWGGRVRPAPRQDAPVDAAAIVRSARSGGSPGSTARSIDLADRLRDESAAAVVAAAGAPFPELELRAAEASLRAAGGDPVRARDLALVAIEMDPWAGPWDVLALSSYQLEGFDLVARAYAAWHPEVADAWNIAGHVDRASIEEKLSIVERAYLLGEGFPLFASNYGTMLVIAGRREEARRVAARLSTGTEGQRVAGARLAVSVDVSEGRFARAFDRGFAALMSLDRVGGIDRGDIALLGLVVELGVLLGRAESTASSIYERFVEPAEPGVDRGPMAAIAVAHACAFAGRSIAARCFSRLSTLVESGFFPDGVAPDTRDYIEGARAYASGDASGAAEAFRRVRGALALERSVIALALERAGDLERADRVDPPEPGLYHQVSGSFVRAARRAAARGDCARATPLAARLAAGWADVDRSLSAVDEARAIVKACASGPTPRRRSSPAP